MIRRFATRLLISLVVLSFLLGACNLPRDDEDDTQRQAANQTAAVQTILARSTTPPPAATSEPTATQGSGGSQPDTDRLDDATFITDVTIPDYLFVEIGADFTKTWRLQNSGDTTWTTAYQIVFEKGDSMGGPLSIPMPGEVKPGEVIDISVDLTAPDTPGEYTSWYILQNADGEKFGVGKDGDLPIFVIITAVSGQSGSPGGIAGGAYVTNVTINGDKVNYTGSCPVSINLFGNITTSGAGTVLWTLEQTGFGTFSFGTYTIKYEGAGAIGWTAELTISSSVNATVRLVATGSNTFTSDSYGFTVNCQ